MQPFRLARSPISGPARAGATVHVNAVLRVYFYPSVGGTEIIKEIELAEKKKDGTPQRVGHTYGFGKLYVLSGPTILRAYPARGGPKETFMGEDQHIHSPIPAGDYVLSSAERYVTPNWPASSIPWGASIRASQNGNIEYNAGHGWLAATGSRHAAMNAAILEDDKRNRRRPSDDAELEDRARFYFDESLDSRFPAGKLATTWQKNDFGAWAFALLKDGKRTGFFIHTTPVDEKNTANDKPVTLEASHGCIHVKPADRNEAMEKRYLRRGVVLHVMPFDAKGPPI